MDAILPTAAGLSARGFSLEGALAATIGREARVAGVDVRSLTNASLPFRTDVVRQGVLAFSRDDDARIEFECRTLREAADYDYYDRFLRAAFFERVRTVGLSG